MLSSAIRHLSLGDVVQNLVFHEQNATCEYRLLREVMSELYKRLYAMLRQLQVNTLSEYLRLRFATEN